MIREKEVGNNCGNKEGGKKWKNSDTNNVGEIVISDREIAR
jgi:hypothetical protein